MELSEGTFLLAGNDACKHGMVRWDPLFHCLIICCASALRRIHASFKLLKTSHLTHAQLAYAANAISLQGRNQLCTPLLEFCDVLAEE
jgi:hypothetical protein